MNEQNHGKRAVIIFIPTSIFILIGHSPILIGPFQCCSLANAATQKEAFAKEQSWDARLILNVSSKRMSIAPFCKRQLDFYP